LKRGLSDSRSIVEISRMVGNAENSSGVWMNSEGHQNQDRQRDRDRQEQVEHHRGQRQDQHHQDGEDAERQRDIAALQDGADFAERQPAPGAPTP